MTMSFPCQNLHEALRSKEKIHTKQKKQHNPCKVADFFASFANLSSFTTEGRPH